MFRYFSTFKNGAHLAALLILLMVGMASCRNNETDSKTLKPSDLKEPLIHANKEALDTEAEQIRDFLRRYQWDTQQTGTGLQYWIYHKGEGPQVEAGSWVELSYTVSFLNGDTAYTSADKGPLVFSPGKAQVITGLEEGILLLRQGDRAKFIIPSHLAYGLIGDQDRIGQKATLVYDVEVLRIKKKTNL